MVRNVSTYGLAESIYRSGYAMMDSRPSKEIFDRRVETINQCIQDYILTDDNSHLNNKHIKRAINLANSKGGGHNQFLTGIVVQFDVTFTNKAWVEAERYTFLNFITSMSTMHRISKFPIREMCDEYTDKESIAIAEKLQKEYLSIDDSDIDMKKEAYLKLLYSLPSGLEVTAAMTTNYRCLRNIYEQRKNHRLLEWRIFCDWIEKLPLAKELIIGGIK